MFKVLKFKTFGKWESLQVLSSFKFTSIVDEHYKLITIANVFIHFEVI